MLKKQNELGDSLFAANDYQKAQQIYKEAIQIDPSNRKMISVFYYKIAAIKFQLLRYNEASTNATNALEFNVENMNALIMRAKCYSKLNDFQNCIKDCNLVLMLENNDYIKTLLDKNSYRLFLKDTTTRAYLNFNENRLMDCIIDCETILKTTEICEIRNLLEKSTESFITQTMQYARHLYNTEKYEMCMSQCDILILKFQNMLEAVNLKLNASNHKSITESINNTKRLYQERSYKECLEYCNLISLNINLVEERKNQYEFEMNQILQHIRSKIESVKAKANLNYEKMNFTECIKDYEYILSIEESSDIRNLLKQAKSEKSFTERLTSTKKLYNLKKYEDCIDNCKTLLKVRELDELKHLIVSCELEIIKQNEIFKIIEEHMGTAQENYENEKFEECIEDCLKVIKHNENYFQAKTLMKKAFDKIVLRASLCFNKAQYEECRKLCLQILKSDDLAEVREMLELSKDALAYEKLTSYHDILQVKKDAEEKTIKKSFHYLCLKYHPDKHGKSTEEMKVYCAKMIKRITQARRMIGPHKKTKVKK